MIAHELAHIKHRDTLTMTITATLAGAIGFLSQFAFFFGMGRDNRNPLGLVGTMLIMILAPLAAMLVQMAISRTREYSADRTGAEICGQPMWLARALQKIEQLARGVVNPDAERNPASAHLFIINPLAHGRGRQSVPHPSADRRAGAPPAADGGRRRRARRPRPLGLRLAPSTNPCSALRRSGNAERPSSVSRPIIRNLLGAKHMSRMLAAAVGAAALSLGACANLSDTGDPGPSSVTYTCADGKTFLAMYLRGPRAIVRQDRRRDLRARPGRSRRRRAGIPGPQRRAVDGRRRRQQPISRSRARTTSRAAPPERASGPDPRACGRAGSAGRCASTRARTSP